MKYAIEVPINNLSFGNCSYNILKEIFNRGDTPDIFLIGEKADLSAFDRTTKEFAEWLNFCCSKAQFKHSRDNPVFKLWHINGSLQSFSKKQYLFTFYELDSPTPLELNILSNQEKVFVSSLYTKNIFESSSLKNIVHCPLGFDKENFFIKNKEYNSDQITFGLVGKLEKRKQHHKVLSAWAKKYGNNKKYALNCAIQNPFLQPEQQSAAISSILKEKYFNINFLGFMPTNSLYNDYLNSNDIILAMSAAEGWGLPEFQSLCLGKHAVVLNAHAYKDWANEKNACLVQPIGKIESHDGIFFNKGSAINQGSYFDWDEDEFISQCESAIKRHEENKINIEGKKLADEFTWSKTVNIIKENIT